MAAIIVPIVLKVVLPLLESEGAEQLVKHIFERHPHLKEKSTMSTGPTAASAVYAAQAAQVAAQITQPAPVEAPAPIAPTPIVTAPVAVTVSPVPQVAPPAPLALAKPTAGQIADNVLHDVITAGILAASIFVKNPAHQQTAANLINAVNELLPLLDAQLNG